MIEPALLIPLLPLAAFFLLALGALWGYTRYLPGQGAWLAIAAIGASFLLFWPVMGGLLASGPRELSMPWLAVGNVQLSLGVVLDPLSVSMVGLVTFVALCVQVYSLGYMHGEAHLTWYYAAHSLFAAAMLGVVLANNLLLLYITWELVGLCSYLLIGFYYERRSAAEAAKKAFITTRLGDVGLLTGILLLFRATGTFQTSAVLAAVEHGSLDAGLLTAAGFLVFLGAMGKSAQFPFHVWLPDAMEGPTPVSALIHAATMVAAGVYLVARLFPLFAADATLLGFITVIGLITSLLGASIALVATDIKKIVAYSTISKLGFMMVALGAGPAGFSAAIFYLITHGFFKALLFLGAGSVIHGTGKQDLSEIGGLRQAMPLTAATFFVASLALAGIPPFSGFWSKDEVLLALSHQSPLVYGLALLSLLLSSAYIGRLWFLLFQGEYRGGHDHHSHEAPMAMAVPMVALAGLSLLGGLVALPGVGQALGLPGGFGSFLFFHQPEPYHLDPAVALTSTAVSVLGLLLAAGFYWQRWWSVAALRARVPAIATALEHKLYIDDIYQWAIDRLVLALGRFIAFFDRAFINDVGVNGSGGTAMWLGERLKYLQTGKLPNYALTMGLGVVVMAAALFTFAR